MRQTRLPDYHFLLIAPNLGAEWLFDAARSYWDRFRPTVIATFELVAYVPADATVAVTVVARRDTIDDLRADLANTAPRALFDPVAVDLFDDMQTLLDNRAAANQPFGVPLEPTTPPGEAVTRAPGSVLVTPPPTRAPGGFITQTPTPTQPPAPVPTQAADSTDSSAPPVQITPGAVTGGSG